MIAHIRRTAITVALLAGAATLAITLVDSVSFAYPTARGDVAAETVASIVALAAAFLAYGRLLRSPSLAHAALFCGLVALGVSNLLFATVPAILDEDPGSSWAWAAVTGRTLAILAIALAAFAPQGPASRGGHLRALSVGVAAATLAGVAVLTVLLADRLPDAVADTLVAQTSGRPDLDTAPALLSLHVLTVVIAGLGATGFVRRAESTGDELNAWLAVGLVLAAAAHVNFLLYPSLYADALFTGDIFRFGLYAALAAGLTREILRFRAGAIEAARLDERQRIARDLHDGLAQEMAVISRNAALLPDGEATERIRDAADRGLRESRQAIRTLAAAEDPRLDRMIAAAAGTAAQRADITVDLRLAQGIEVDRETGEAIARIVGEAVTNAARHSGTEAVRVSLTRRGATMHVEIVDEGIGFTSAPTTGFGLRSMHERARLLDARLEIDSSPTTGTRVSLTW